jgi:hypothetical protein
MDYDTERYFRYQILREKIIALTQEALAGDRDFWIIRAGRVLETLLDALWLHSRYEDISDLEKLQELLAFDEFVYLCRTIPAPSESITSYLVHMPGYDENAAVDSMPETKRLHHFLIMQIQSVLLNLKDKQILGAIKAFDPI